MSPKNIKSSDGAIKVEAFEYFTGGDERQKRLDDFINGRVTHLDLDYPKLDDSSDIEKIYNYNSIESFNSENTKTVTNEYQLAQAELVMQAAAARRLLLRGDKEQLALVEDRLKNISEELYGLPDRKLVLSAKKAALELIGNKEFSGRAAEIYEQLSEGFVFRGEDNLQVNVRPFLMPEETETIDSAMDMPILSDGALNRLHEKIIEEFGYAHKIIEAYWNDNIATRKEEDRLINPYDAKWLFERCIESYSNTGNDAHINVLLEENSTSTNWSSEKNAVVIAGKRKPFKDVDEFFGVFVHEFGVHGRRWMNGINPYVPELSKGVYTVKENGSLIDYERFEEGLASTIQKAAIGEKEKWGIASLGLYLVVGLAYENRSAREIFEILRRVRSLSRIKKNDTDITDKIWADSSKDTATNVVRIFRGMPKATNPNRPVVYPKDMAYLVGKIKVIEYLNSMAKLSSDEWNQIYHRLFLGKIDNSEPMQESLVTSV